MVSAELERDANVWVLTPWSVRRGVFNQQWAPPIDKCLVDFSDGPSLWDRGLCFDREKDAYAAAASKKMEEAQAAMKLASEYSKKAAGLPDEA